MRCDTEHCGNISRLFGACFAFSRPIAIGQATLFDDFTGAPTHGQIFGRRRRAISCQRIAVDIQRATERTIFLRIAMPRHDFHQLHFLRPVFRLQMLVKCYPYRRVKAPCRAMRDNQRIEAFALPNCQPARPASRQPQSKRRANRQSVYRGRINQPRLLLAGSGECQNSFVGLEITKSQRQRYQIFAIGAQRIDRHTARCNRAFGQFGILKALEDDVFMTEMIFGKLPDLRPFKADKTDHIRIVTIAGYGVTGANALFGLLPAFRRSHFGMVGNRPKIERRTMPGIVTRIGQWVRSLAAINRQRP